MLLPSFIIHTLLWAAGFFFLFRIPYCQKVKGEKYSPPSVSVVIPARNEEASLPYLLNSLNAQTLAPLEIIVVDDQSQDRTGEIARKAGARVVELNDLPDGWLGKNWACYQGAASSKGDILVFLDADTCLEEDGLEGIITTYLSQRGVISVQPYHKMKRLYEQLSAFFNLVVVSAINAFTILGNKLKPSGLFGPVLVINRNTYFKTGGHKEVRGQILEDMAMASKLRKHGIEVNCFGGKGSVSFRMYPEGIKQIIGGWGKGFARGAFQTSIPVLVIIVAWITGSIGTLRELIEALLGGNTSSVILWLILYLCFALQIYWMLFRLGNFKLYTALLYPVPLLFFVLVFVISLFNIFLRRRVQWKGRHINIGGGIK